MLNYIHTSTRFRSKGLLIYLGGSAVIITTAEDSRSRLKLSSVTLRVISKTLAFALLADQGLYTIILCNFYWTVRLSGDSHDAVGEASLGGTRKSQSWLHSQSLLSLEYTAELRFFFQEYTRMPSRPSHRQSGKSAKGAVISVRGNEWGCTIARPKGNDTPESADNDQQAGSCRVAGQQIHPRSPSTFTRSRRRSSLDRLHGWRLAF